MCVFFLNNMRMVDLRIWSTFWGLCIPEKNVKVKFLKSAILTIFRCKSTTSHNLIVVCILSSNEVLIQNQLTMDGVTYKFIYMLKPFTLQHPPSYYFILSM